MNSEESGFDIARGRNALERVGQTFALVVGGHLPEALSRIGRALREGMRRQDGAGNQRGKQRPASEAMGIVSVLVHSPYIVYPRYSLVDERWRCDLRPALLRLGRPLWN